MVVLLECRLGECDRERDRLARCLEVVQAGEAWREAEVTEEIPVVGRFLAEFWEAIESELEEDISLKAGDGLLGCACLSIISSTSLAE